MARSSRCRTALPLRPTEVNEALKEHTAMKRILISLLAVLSFTASLPVAASEGGAPLDRFPKERVTDLAALQNGAKLFVNYCLSCHSAAFMRFNRLRDIGLTEQQIKDNLLFTTDKVGDTMKAAIDPKQAKQWFGANPPDLTLIARSRSGHGGTGESVRTHEPSLRWMSVEGDRRLACGPPGLSDFLSEKSLSRATGM